VNLEILFIIVMCALETGAGVAYLCKRDWPHGLYWLLCVALTIIVTFFMEKR